MLAFDITQFFLSLNYQLLPLILDKASFDSKIFLFFYDYLVGKKTKYLWNSFSSSSFNVNVGVGQGSALSPILSVLYLFPIFHIVEKRLKNIKILISIIFFKDDGLFISQNKSLVFSNSHLFCSYHIMFSLLEQFSLVIEHRKMEVFHFSSSYEVFNSLLLDISTLGGLFFIPRKHGITWDSFLTESWPSNNMSTFTPTKWYQLLNT